MAKNVLLYSVDANNGKAKWGLGILAAGAIAFLTGCSGGAGGDIVALRSYQTPGVQAAYGPVSPTPVVAGTGGIQRDPYLWPSSAPTVYAESAIMVDARTGEVLYYKNPDQRRAAASTQKLLTALLITERGQLDRTFTIAASDTRAEPTKLHLKAGERYTRRHLLNAILVKSANDASEALARDHSGSTAAFARAMNAKARQLGATKSNFVNPHGLPAAGQYSNSRDLARIAFYAYRDPTIRSMVKQKGMNFRYSDGRVRYLEATNKLLSRLPMANGMKTGYTNAAGKCLISSASLGRRDIILVQLGSKSKYLWDDSAKLLTWGMQSRSFHVAGL